MIYREVIKDLFSVPAHYYLMHCISDDYVFGAGIAKEFKKRYGMRRKLEETRDENPIFQITGGHCINIENVFNLVTKDNYWDKPTYVSLRNALEDVADKLLHMNITGLKIAMPLIGCGLDRLQWDIVSKIICDVFKFYDGLEIIVCIRKEDESKLGRPRMEIITSNIEDL